MCWWELPRPTSGKIFFPRLSLEFVQLVLMLTISPYHRQHASFVVHESFTWTF